MKVNLKKRKTLFDVVFLTDDDIFAVNKNKNEKRIFKYDEVQFHFDADWEMELINNREILSIKKPRCASFFMYYAVLESIKGHLNEDIYRIVILDELDRNHKRGFVKEIKMFVNNRGIKVLMSGIAYKNIYDIRIVDLKSNILKESLDIEFEITKQRIERDKKRIAMLSSIKNKINLEI